MGADLLRDDPRLREAFRAGERWAMQAVYEHYLPLVGTIVCRGSGGFRGFFDPAQRDDALQTVFVRAFEDRTRHAYNGVDPYSSFLRGVAQNVCRQLLDKDRRFHREPEPFQAEPPDLEQRLIGRQTAAVLRAFEAQLPTDLERTILTRYFKDGASEEGLAVELGLTRYRTRKLIKTLHKRMLKHLEAHGITHA